MDQCLPQPMPVGCNVLDGVSQMNSSDASSGKNPGKFPNQNPGKSPNQNLGTSSNQNLGKSPDQNLGKSSSPNSLNTYESIELADEISATLRKM